jgi:hypothetical protein
MSSAITKTLSRVVYSCHISPQPIYFACEYEHRRPSNRYHSIAKQNKKRETFAALNVSPAGSRRIFLFLVKSFAAARGAGGSAALYGFWVILEIGLANRFEMPTRINSGLKTLNWLCL